MELLGRYSRESGLHQKLDRAWQHAQTIPTKDLTLLPPPVVRPRQLSRRLSAEQITNMITDYQAGLSSRQVADRYDISKQSALKILRQHQVTRPRSRITDERVYKAKALFDQGLSVAKAANKLGIPATTLTRAFRKRGLPTSHT